MSEPFPFEVQNSTQVPEAPALSIASLVFGILNLCLLPFIGGLIAVITGHMARSEIRASKGTRGGDGLALSGLILGYAGMALQALAICGMILLFFVFAPHR